MAINGNTKNKEKIQQTKMRSKDKKDDHNKNIMKTNLDKNKMKQSFTLPFKVF